MKYRFVAVVLVVTVLLGSISIADETLSKLLKDDAEIGKQLAELKCEFDAKAYHLEMPEEKLKGSDKKCLGMPAKRFQDKWVWVLINRVEIRFGLSEKSLESDRTLDLIVKSFNLETIKRL